MSRIIYVNGRFLPEDQATISVLDRGFIFGDGIYEVTAVISGLLVDCNAHLERLERSCREIKLDLPWSRDELLELHREIVCRNAMHEGSIYLQVTRGAADREFVVPAGVPPTLVLFTQARPIAETAMSRTGISVVSCPDLRWKRRDIKSVNLLAPVLARQFAKENGAQEAWLIEDGLVNEGAASTAWIVKDRRLISRPLSYHVLPGITRRAVLALLDRTGLSFDERPFTLTEALAADEAIATSAGYLALGVISIDGKVIGQGRPGPVATELRRLYLELAGDGGVLG